MTKLQFVFVVCVLAVLSNWSYSRTLVIWDGQMVIDFPEDKAEPPKVWLLPTATSRCNQSCFEEAAELKPKKAGENQWQYSVPPEWFKMVDSIAIDSAAKKVTAQTKMSNRDLTVFYPVNPISLGDQNRVCKAKVCGQLYKVDMNKLLKCEGKDCPRRMQKKSSQ